MGARCPGSLREGKSAGRCGFSLLELLLVTVVLGVLALLAVPYFARAREGAYLALMESEARHLKEGVETYLTLNDGSFPTSLAQLEDGSTFSSSGEVDYCIFVAVPETAWRDPYVLAMVGHPATTLKVIILYPAWGSRILDFDSGRQGC